MFLLDANVLAEPLKPSPNVLLIQRLREHEGQLYTAATVWHELVFGTWRLPESRRRAALQDYLEGLAATELKILPYDRRAAEWHGRERARLQAIGKTPPFADSQIAAVAAVNDMTLVTRNTRDFAEFSGLRLVDWADGP